MILDFDLVMSREIAIRKDKINSNIFSYFITLLTHTKKIESKEIATLGLKEKVLE